MHPVSKDGISQTDLNPQAKKEDTECRLIPRDGQSSVLRTSCLGSYADDIDLPLTIFDYKRNKSND